MPIIDARYYKSLVICPTKNMASELAPMLSQGLPLAPILPMQEYPSRRVLVDLLKAQDPKLCFLDFSNDTERAFAVVADIQMVNSNLPVIALLSTNTPDLVLRCLRQGATEFLIRPFTSDQMDSAIEKIARLHPPPANKAHKGGKVIAVVPAKGACGATTIACNLAYQAKRLGSKRTLLSDLDPLTGTIAFLLKLKSSYSFLDVLSRQGSLDSDLWKQMVVTSQGVDVLLAPETLVEGAGELNDPSAIVEYAQSTYEISVLDCGSAYGQWNLTIASLADQVILATTNELPSLLAAQKVLAYYDQYRIDQNKVHVVVNRYEREIGLNSDSIGSALQTEISQVIPSDYETVQKSLLDGKPIPANSNFGKNLGALATRLCSRPTDRDDDKPTPLGGLLSIFSRASS